MSPNWIQLDDGTFGPVTSAPIDCGLAADQSSAGTLQKMLQRRLLILEHESINLRAETN